jgi:hypothetical protein
MIFTISLSVLNFCAATDSLFRSYTRSTFQCVCSQLLRSVMKSNKQLRVTALCFFLFEFSLNNYRTYQCSLLCCTIGTIYFQVYIMAINDVQARRKCYTCFHVETGLQLQTTRSWDFMGFPEL